MTFLANRFIDVDELPPIAATCPLGYHHEWLPSGDDWRLADGAERATYRCRQPRCQKAAVAVLLRKAGGYGDKREHTRRWFCCERHMYGRIVRKGRVLEMRMVPDGIESTEL